jgi:hypothetical protein
MKNIRYQNRYAPEQIAQTWSTVADILSKADVIFPGHGDPFKVTTTVIEEVSANWPKAAYCNRCPDVNVSLNRKLEFLDGH